MPGVFVVAGDRFSPEQRTDFVRRMIALDRERTIAPFGPKPDWVIETADDELASIGCAHLGVFSETTMSSREVPRPLTAVAFGNISLRDGEPVARMPDAAATILDMYLQDGAEFVEKLEGDFVIVIADPSEKRLLVFNDRLGLVPHYVADPPGLFAMAPNLSAVACLPGVDDEVDMVGLADLLTFGYILADDTIVEGVKVLPPASASEYRDGRWRTRAYWELRVEPGRTPRASTQEHIERIGELMSDAVRRCVPADGKVTVSLSGGLDSRFVACALHKEGIAFDAFTLGADDACEVKFSRMLCERLDIEQTVVEPRYDEAWERLSWLAARQDGMLNVFHNFGSSHRVEPDDPPDRMIFTGFLGETIAGHDLTPTMLVRGRAPMGEHLWEAHCVVAPDRTRPTTDGTAAGCVAATRQRFDSVAATVSHECAFAAVERYEYLQRQRRFTNHGNTSTAGTAETRSPFGAPGLFDYFVGLPLPPLFLKRLYRSAIALLFPHTAYVPFTFVDLPPGVSNPRILFRRLGKRGRLPDPVWRLWRRLFWVPEHPGHRHLDMRRLLSAVLPQMRAQLLGGEAASAPGLDPDGLRRIVEEHTSGREDHSDLLQQVFSYVWWCEARPAKWSTDVPVHHAARGIAGHEEAGEARD